MSQIFLLLLLSTLCFSEKITDQLTSGSQNKFEITANQSKILKLKFVNTNGSEHSKNFHFETGYYTLRITLISKSELINENPLSETITTAKTSQVEKETKDREITLNIFHKLVYLVLDPSPYTAIMLQYKLNFSNATEIVIEREFVSHISLSETIWNETLAAPNTEETASLNTQANPVSLDLFSSFAYVISLLSKTSVQVKLPASVFNANQHSRVYVNSCSPRNRLLVEFPSLVNKNDYRCLKQGHESGSECFFIDGANAETQKLASDNGFSISIFEKGVDFLLLLSKQTVQIDSKEGKFAIYGWIEDSEENVLLKPEEDPFTAANDQQTADEEKGESLSAVESPKRMNFSLISNGFLQTKNEILYIPKVNTFDDLNQNQKQKSPISYQLLVFKSKLKLYFFKNCFFQLSYLPKKWKPVYENLHGSSNDSEG